MNTGIFTQMTANIIPTNQGQGNKGKKQKNYVCFLIHENGMSKVVIKHNYNLIVFIEMSTSIMVGLYLNSFIFPCTNPVV